ncbi:MAG: gliding motility protein GldD [Tannerellaceae bacterium]|jgi:gliding motility-associated lipoprotein GldD|nr:gliding motility protein GldD [Tannerellaceae bacterium]
MKQAATTYRSDMQRKRGIWFVLGLCSAISCSQYTPKPRGYFRIEPPAPVYEALRYDSLPYAFQVSSLARVEFPPAGSPGRGINLSYPELEATIYCSYLPVSPSTLGMAIDESRALISRQAKNARRISEQAYEHPEAKVYASLYELDGSPAPLQFTLTDSLGHFFRGVLLYERVVNADSLAPVTQYLKADILELIQSFSWKN